MKTAVSLPDRLYEDAEKTAKSLGIPRSQLFAKALEEFINHHRQSDITERLNAIYGKSDAHEDSRISRAGLEALRELTKNDTW